MKCLNLKFLPVCEIKRRAGRVRSKAPVKLIKKDILINSLIDNDNLQVTLNKFILEGWNKYYLNSIIKNILEDKEALEILLINNKHQLINELNTSDCMKLINNIYEDNLRVLNETN